MISEVFTKALEEAKKLQRQKEEAANIEEELKETSLKIREKLEEMGIIDEEIIKASIENAIHSYKMKKEREKFYSDPNLEKEEAKYTPEGYEVIDYVEPTRKNKYMPEVPPEMMNQYVQETSQRSSNLTASGTPVIAQPLPGKVEMPDMSETRGRHGGAVSDKLKHIKPEAGKMFTWRSPDGACVMKSPTDPWEGRGTKIVI